MVTDLAEKTGMKFTFKYTDADMTGAVSLWLSTPRADFLRGRFVSVNWRMDELEAMKDDILKHNLLKSAFNAKLGA